MLAETKKQLRFSIIVVLMTNVIYSFDDSQGLYWECTNFSIADSSTSQECINCHQLNICCPKQQLIESSLQRHRINTLSWKNHIHLRKSFKCVQKDSWCNNTNCTPNGDYSIHLSSLQNLTDELVLKNFYQRLILQFCNSSEMLLIGSEDCIFTKDDQWDRFNSSILSLSTCFDTENTIIPHIDNKTVLNTILKIVLTDNTHSALPDDKQWTNICGKICECTLNAFSDTNQKQNYDYCITYFDHTDRHENCFQNISLYEMSNSSENVPMTTTITSNYGYGIVAGFSSFCLLLTLVVHIAYLKVNNHTKLFICHVFSLFMAYTSFATLQLCQCVERSITSRAAFPIQYPALLSAVLWLHVMGFDVWRGLSTMNKMTEGSQLNKASQRTIIVILAFT